MTCKLADKVAVMTGQLGEITEEQFNRTSNTDVRGPLFTVQKVLPLLSKGSPVILTGSMVSIRDWRPARCITHQSPPYASSVPLGRLGTPDDLGKAAVFLASGDSAYVTGIELFVDGAAAQI